MSLTPKEEARIASLEARQDRTEKWLAEFFANLKEDRGFSARVVDALVTRFEADEMPKEERDDLYKKKIARVP